MIPVARRRTYCQDGVNVTAWGEDSVLRAWFGQENERLSIWNRWFAAVSMTIVNNFVAMYLLDALHATNSEMGLLNSLPSLVNLFGMLVAAAVVSKLSRKKVLCAAVTTVSGRFTCGWLWSPS